jgi:hypothetical protein
MRVLLFVLTLCVLLPSQGFAQDNLPAACKLLSEHNDVAYQPGVDVDGNAVVPADLNTNFMGGVLNIIKVPLEFDLAQRIAGLNINGVRQGLVDNSSSLGVLEFHQTGKVMYNGQDITRPMMNLCAKSHREVSVEETKVDTPETPAAPEFEMPNMEVAPPKIEMPKSDLVEGSSPRLPNALAVTSEEAIQRPAVSAPIVEKVATPKISQPAEPKLPLVGTPKGEQQVAQSDIIQGQDFRDYNE